MSDYDVGYGKPPRKSRWQKGQSGNPRGRPRKHVPALTTREIRRTILQVAFMQVPISTPDGKRMVHAFRAAYVALLGQAMKGQISSMRLWLKLFEDAIRQHSAANRGFAALEKNEQLAAIDMLSDFELEALNYLRGRTHSNTLRPK